MPAIKSVRCAVCKHFDTKHREAQGRMPAHCASCTGARSLHRMERS